MNSIRFKLIISFIFFIVFCFVFSPSSFAQKKQAVDKPAQSSMEEVFTADKPAPGQSAKLVIIETKLPDGKYEYRFTIHNESTSLFLKESFINGSEASKRGKNVMWNWGLITGDEELASSLTCPSKNDLDNQFFHLYDKKGVLICKRWIQNNNNSLPEEVKVERTDKITNIVAPKFVDRFILKSEGFNPSDGMTIGFVWYWAGKNWVIPGKSLGEFGFTLKKPLDKKKIKFWTFYKTEFDSKNIEFISKVK